MDLTKMHEMLQTLQAVTGTLQNLVESNDTQDACTDSTGETSVVSSKSSYRKRWRKKNKALVFWFSDKTVFDPVKRCAIPVACVPQPGWRGGCDCPSYNIDGN